MIAPLMHYFQLIVALLREWLPFLITLLISIVVVSAAYYLILKRRPPTGNVVGRQMFIAAITGILVVLLILELPIDNEPRGQLMSLLGILVTAAVALSSTTLLGNAMAGFMLRSIRNFRAGDFIVVDGQRGRVSELRHQGGSAIRVEAGHDDAQRGRDTDAAGDRCSGRRRSSGVGPRSTGVLRGWK